MAAQSKAVLMANKRAALKKRGLVPVTVWIKPRDRDRLNKYVNKTLLGHSPPKK